MSSTDGAAAVGVETKLEPKRLVGIAYVVLGITGGMFLTRVIEALLGALRVNDPMLLGLEELTLSSILGFAIAIGAVVAAYTNAQMRAGSLDIAAELKRVTWPSVAETKVSTIAVIIASVVSALILFLFDFVASKVMTEWVPGALEWMARL